MIAITTNLNQINIKIANLANLLGKKSKILDHMLWDAGDVMRGHCIDAANVMIYDTPESDSYKRTRFLKSSIYVTTKQKRDYADVRAWASSLPPAVYPDRKDLAEVYKMAPFVPYTGARGVRVTAGAIYAMDVETGNNWRGARPFMRTGLATSSREVEVLIHQGVVSAVQMVARKQTGLIGQK